jgi:ring-1,2-phenylacetyl-CoA epoxidase subunit PaaD
MVTSTVQAAASAAVTAATVRDALRDVSDPEIPAISIMDLGIVERVEVPPDPARPIHVELLPTFVGCPAIAMIQSAVSERLAAFGREVEVEVSFSVPWTSDRISPAGLDALRRSGFAPPAATPDAVQCPYCDSGRVAMDSAFGPTLCRALYYCRDCRQPFEAFKAV